MCCLECLCFHGFPPECEVLIFQVIHLLGLLAWMGYRPGAIAPLEWALSVAHVLVGGLLLAQVVAAAMWSARLGHREIHARTTADVGGAA